jgi:apolipoprotein N-acyltransferase
MAAAAPAPGLWALGAAVLSGLLLAAAFPKWDQTYLLPVALVPLLWALRGQSRKAALGLGLAAGLAYFLGLLYWIVYVTYVFGGMPLPLCLLTLFLLAGYLSLYRAAWTLGVNWAQARGFSVLWFGPALWVALELGQTYIFSGFPWELLGTGLYRSPLLLQAADLAGVYGLSFLVVLVNAALYLLLLPPSGRRRPLRPLAAVALILLAWVGYGYFRLGAMARLAAESPKVRVAVVQGNIQQGEKWKKEMVQATLDRYGELTGKVAGAHLIIWPETAAPFFFLRYPDLTARVQDIARASGGYLLFGAPALEFTPQGESLYNRAYLLTPQGEVAGYYDKAHLVPYGEYVPLKRYLPFLGKMTVMVGDLTPGEPGGVVSLPEGAVGPLVCFESIFPELSRAQVQNGARLLVNLTNDAWYGTTSAPYQSLAMAAVRCAETRVCMARAANTGISAFINGDGRILWESGLFVPEARALELPWLPGGSVYTRIGDAFAWACTVFAGLILILGRRRRSR